MFGMIRRLTFALLTLIAAPAAAQDAAPPPATVVVAFDRDTITPLIVEGLANKETERPLEANDPVRIASISKLIMALAALRLMDEGKVDLDRDVSDYLGWQLRSPYHPRSPVTLYDLLAHRAGLSTRRATSSRSAKALRPSWPTLPLGGTSIIPVRLRSNTPISVRPSWRRCSKPRRASAMTSLVERLVFAPLGVKACLNWIGCGPDMQARAVTLYRDTGEVARDAPGDLPPNCTIPVAGGRRVRSRSLRPRHQCLDLLAAGRGADRNG